MAVDGIGTVSHCSLFFHLGREQQLGTEKEVSAGRGLDRLCLASLSSGA
jgi:hypothetical protein